MKRLSGRRVVVTGGAEGIGAAIVRVFAAEGATVAILDRCGEEAALLAAEVGGYACVVDLSDVAATREAMEKALGRLGGIDVLVNNAGARRFAPLLEMEAAELGQAFATPAQCMLIAIQAAAWAMIGMRAPAEDCAGKVINVASAGGPASGGQAHYAAAKAAVTALTRVAAHELGPHGITVNCLCPGYLLDRAEVAPRGTRELDTWSVLSPLGRLGAPQDVARAALFLASSDSDYLTGDSLDIAGGMVLR
ncbi:SDR family NAD(P)-dependent oxidoreductase [Geodermatophilus ruber]|uniref:3-oxoacyl-[acyl-carrier protein] reductase n=1 Tax=Geodermatophilus ruber TaxID=504800 RepID=A0A1I4DS12_9ACTN|nr:SDR family oxidoreductase [Geodermatophilus ruber]SFK96422.1 3-oxoacyl-[acyl-carrier protein] reductase [Geodermatophilus ruber]